MSAVVQRTLLMTWRSGRPVRARRSAGLTSGFYDNTLDMTLTDSYRAGFITANGGTPATAQTALFAAIEDGRAYLNIHSTSFLRRRTR